MLCCMKNLARVEGRRSGSASGRVVNGATMSPAPNRTAPSTLHRQWFDVRARTAIMVAVTALGLTGCGSASEDQDRPAPATKASSTAAASARRR